MNNIDFNNLSIDQLRAEWSSLSKDIAKEYKTNPNSTRIKLLKEKSSLIQRKIYDLENATNVNNNQK